MHASQSLNGGDLKSDTVTIIGATLDLQEKDVKQVTFYKSVPGTYSSALGYDSHI